MIKLRLSKAWVLVNLRLEKKHKYFIFSFLVTLCLAGFWILKPGNERVIITLIAILITVIGTAIAQYPNVKLNTIFYITILPMHLLGGALMSLLAFPNLGTPFVVVSLVLFGTVFYILYLVNNIFLVVKDKEDTIPLYRAAITWAQIIIIIIAIPFFAGVFKLPLISYFQNGIAVIASFLFSVYMMWILQFDKDIRELGVGERTLLSSFVSLVVFIMLMGVSFIPTESFLKAIFGSAILLSMLGYLYNHFTNRITKRLMWEYLGISLVFLIILLVFMP